jgi:DNA topoisomerase-2
MKQQNITEFFDTSYVDAASYDNIRKIASYIDGLKNSGRKVLHTVLKKNINKEMKVSRLKSVTSEFNEYIHGEDNLAGVIVTMARNYVGSNNLPLLKAEGSFGTRFIKEASADRYIFTMAQPFLRHIFRKEDDDILIKQVFEGSPIEPKFYVPIIPMVLVNGSNGISSGYAQNVLPRKVEDIVKMTETFLKSGKVQVPSPAWRGYNGRVVKAGDNKWIVYGEFTKRGTTTIEITEVPVGIQLKEYLNHLDDLKENGVITSYEDLSENDEFHFKVRVNRRFFEQDEEKQYEILRLKETRAMTENLTFINEDNRIIVFDTLEEMFLRYADIRLRFYEERKFDQLKKLAEDIKRNVSIMLFIEAVNSGQVVLKNKTKKEILEQLETLKNIYKIDDSYDYLLKIPIYSLSKEKYEEAKRIVQSLKDQYMKTKKLQPKEMWLEDLSELKKELRKVK